MWCREKKKFKTHSLILYMSLKILCLGSKVFQIIIFILNSFRGYLVVEDLMLRLQNLSNDHFYFYFI
jgi:hypothetical protein